MSHGAPARRLLALLYLAGWIILADQIADIAATILFQPGTSSAATWRFAAFGIAASRANILLVADVLLFAAAVGLDQRIMLRILGVGHLLFAVALGIGLGMFGLDALEVQRVVGPAGRSAFIAAAVRTAVVALLGMLLLGWAGVAAWRLSKASGRSGSSREEAPLITIPPDIRK
jgi:hypothetical protein